MAKKSYEIPGTERKMIVDHDKVTNRLSVTDESGRPAKKVAKGAMKIKVGDIEATVIDAPDGTTFVTKHNPTCRWVYKNGQWYYICS